jgi:hypothetical protein
VLKFAPVAVGLPILEKIDNVFPKQNHGWPRTRLAVRGYSGPEVDFREITIDVPQERLWTINGMVRRLPEI